MCVFLRLGGRELCEFTASNAAEWCNQRRITFASCQSLSCTSCILNGSLTSLCNALIGLPRGAAGSPSPEALKNSVCTALRDVAGWHRGDGLVVGLDDLSQTEWFYSTILMKADLLPLQNEAVNAFSSRRPAPGPGSLSRPLPRMAAPGRCAHAQGQWRETARKAAARASADSSAVAPCGGAPCG